jgi:tetratricopeptide (TPR) repeat protein
VPNAELEAIANAIEQIRQQVPIADEQRRAQMLDELAKLRAMATSVLDAWMAVDDTIEETLAEIGSNPNAYESSESQIQTPPSRTADATRTGGEPLIPSPIHLVEPWFDLSLKAECALRKGLGYYDLEMYGAAADALHDAVAQNDTPATRIYLALCHLQAGHLDSAALQLKKAGENASDDLTRQAILEAKTQLYAAERNWHAAIHVFYELLHTSAQSPDIWFNLGVCHTQLDELSAAERCFAKAMHLDPADNEARLWRALCLCLTNRREEAQKLIQDTQFDPDFIAQTSLLFVVVCLSASLYPEARAAAEYLRHHAPTDATGDYLLALCELTNAKPKQAIVYAKRAMTLAPNHVQATLIFGFSSFLLDDITRAKLALTSVENKIDSTSQTACLLELVRAQIASMTGDHSLAEEQFNRLTVEGRAQTKRLATLYRGMLYLHQNKLQLANADFHRAKQLGIPENWIQIARTKVKTRQLCQEIN